MDNQYEENKDKIKLKDRAVAVNVFTYEMDPNGVKVLWTRTFRTDHYVNNEED